MPVRYRSAEEDSGRWLDFPYRPGDIVISTRSKHGTTWMQMICALLVFQTPELPARLPRLSPWLDWLTLPLDEVQALLEDQQHRRFIKTHTRSTASRSIPAPATSSSPGIRSTRPSRCTTRETTSTVSASGSSPAGR